MSQNLSQSPPEEELEEQWQLSRVKLMLRDFLVEVFNETNFSKNSNLAEVDAFIEKWVKYHFQY